MRKIHFSTMFLLGICCIGWVLCLLTPKTDLIVYVTQMRLEELGYDPGPIDGMIDEKTADAIRKFQHDHDLPVTGELDEKTIQKLGSNPQTSDENTKPELEVGGELSIEGRVIISASDGNQCFVGSSCPSSKNFHFFQF